MKTTVIYHSADFDGEFCHQIARKFLGDEAVYLGWNFGDPPVTLDVLEVGPVYIMDLPIDQVFGFDFTQPETIPPQFSASADLPDVIWIDHHKSSIESHPRAIPGYRIDGVAACRLVWQWFTINEHNAQAQTNETLLICALPLLSNYGGPIKDEDGKVIGRHPYLVSEPLAVKLAGQYDVWDKEDEFIDLFQHGLRSQELTASDWEALLSCDEGVVLVMKLLERAEILDYAQKKQNASIIRDIGFTFEWEGLTWLACNHARYNSLLFTAGLTPYHDACFGFKWTGKHWSISLYHAPGMEHHDLSVIAKKYGREIDPATGKPFGGGGHKGACGFATNKLPFLK